MSIPITTSALVTAIPTATPASPNAHRANSSIGTWIRIAASASTGNHRARPRTNTIGYTTVAIVDAIIHGTR